MSDEARYKLEPGEKWYYVSSRIGTGSVETIDDKIISTPPIWKKFEGRTLGILVEWLRSKGGSVKLEEMFKDEDTR